MASDDEEGLTREEAKRILRRLELDAYSSVITAFRAQGDLNREKKQALNELATHLSISNERHRAEVRRVVNDDSLDTIADCLHGMGTVTEWSIEGKRLVSLTPRLVPQTVFTAKASHTANAVSQENSKLPPKKGVSPGPRDRAAIISSKLERFEERYKAQEDNLPEPVRSNALSKSQDSDKTKRKKKQNQTVNKVLKPSKLNLQPKVESKTSSSTNVNKNLLSPTSIQKTMPENSRSGFHEKPIILQRSPQKTTPASRPHTADPTASSHYPYNPKATSSSQSSSGNTTVITSSNQQRQALAAGSNVSVKSSKGVDPTSSMQMKFKTPVVKSKAKPVKSKTGTQLSRPSSIPVGHGTESLNVLATSTVVPMAPISPVKSVIPSNVRKSSVVTSDGTEEHSSDPVKVIQMHKSTSVIAPQSSSMNTTSKSYVVVSSSTSTKSGSTQRVVALGNVPISRNQQLKIASIPNVLQQPGTKIVSIAKSMPMTTGFKMIAVTTVVPGSTQVKTVYIATPIMSVTKTSSQSQGTISNQASATKLLQTLVSGSVSPVKSAHTDVSPSTLLATGKPSLGVMSTKGSMPLSSASISSVVKATTNRITSSVMSTVFSTASMATVPIASGSTQISKTLSIQNQPKTPERLRPVINTIPTIDVRYVVNEPRILQTSSFNGRQMTSFNPLQVHGSNPSGSTLNDAENADDAILLAGEKFLADLAAKFSKSDSSSTKVVASESETSATSVSDASQGGVRSESSSKTESQNSELASKVRIQHDAESTVNDSKVIVRKIGDEYNSPLEMPSNAKEEKQTSVVADGQTGITVSLDRVKKMNSAENDIVARSVENPKRLERLDSGPILNSSEAFGSASVTNNFVSNLDQNSEGIDACSRNFGLVERRASPNEKQLVCANQDQPQNNCNSFSPANGDANKNLGTDSKSLHVSSPVIPSANLSLENSQVKPNSIASPVRSSGMINSAGYRKALTSEVEENSHSKVPSGSNEEPTGSQYLRTIFPSTTSHDLLDSKEPRHPVALKNAGQSFDLFSNITTTCTDSIVVSGGPTYTSPLNSPRNKTSPVSIRNSNRKDTAPLQSDIKSISENESLNDPLVPQLNHREPVVLGQFNAGVGDNVLLSNREEVLKDELKLLKHTPKISKGNTRSSKFDPVSSESNLSSELIGKASSGSPYIQESPNKNVHSTDVGRSTSKKRKLEAVSPVGWIKGALSLLYRVSRFRGANKQRGEMNAASWFTRPVDPAEAPGYYKVIKKPMDFSTVRKKLEGGVYKDFTEFYSDMHLIKSNCYMYNPAEHLARKDCDLVFNFFEEECCKFLQKQQNLIESPSKKAKVDAT